ncbi:uroporphyrinogen decarboxylase [Planctomycetales bacterium]|nr:uroporphyrinogen decarboxylase [Planctomycetales bacterium]
MSDTYEDLYNLRLARYYTAMRNGKPDRVPVRPFAAEVTAIHAGMTCQDVTQDYNLAFEAILKCCRDFDWDATPANMVYIWSGVVQAAGIKYYALPGVQIPPTTAFQYIEPPEDEANMQDDEYDELIADPTGFLANRWLPRVTYTVKGQNEPNTYASNMTLLSGMAAMKNYFNAYGPHIARMRQETGTVSAICGILKAPFDILADKLRGYKALCMDLYQRPAKVQAACEALAPHLLYMAKRTSDPSKTVPVGLWLHRGCVPFVSPPQFERFFWPTLKWIIEELWKDGIQTLFYAEGNWNPNLKHIKTLPEKSIVYHVDRGDIFEVHREVGDKFALSGGVPNDILAFGTPDDVRLRVKAVIEGVAKDGGYICDASAIMQDDTKIENLQAMCQAAQEFGTY